MTVEETFAEHRPLLFSIAYEILGSVVDAEDVLQESYLRWRDVDHDAVEHRRAYLAQIVTREALQSLRRASRRRERYIGPWLPEPLSTDPASDAADGPRHLLVAEEVRTAMLLVLETLGPEQRAVFVLREVFDFTHAEIAAALGKSEAAVRQIAHRARRHVHARRPPPMTSADDTRATLERCLAAVAENDLPRLMDALAPDVVALVDGGGIVNAARVPVRGRARVARLLFGLARVGARMGEVEYRLGVYNGLPALLVLIDGRLDSVTSVEIRAGRVVAGYCVRNPEKLTAVAT